MTYLEINGISISVEEIAEKFGIQGQIVRPVFCQEVPAGMLRAVANDSEPFRGMELELSLANVADTQPVYFARAEQPNPDGEAEKPTVYLYGRNDEYVAYMRIDTRSDEQVDEEPENTRITVSGDPGDEVQVFAENRYVSLYSRPDPQEEEKIPF